MFTVNHFIWLGLCALFVTVGLMAAKKTKMSKKTASYIAAGISIASEFSKIMSDMTDSDEGGMVLSPKSLPFHLCSMMIFVIFYLAFSKNEEKKDKVVSFFVPVALAGGIAALLIPTNGVDFLDIGAYQCFVYHAGIVWYALYYIVTGQVDLGRRAYLRNILILLCLAFGNIYINSALSAYGTNFMYVRKPPMDGLPVLNLDHGWYAYFATLCALGIVLMTLVHLPLMLKERKKTQK